MTDTTPDIEQRMADMMAAKTPAQRLQMASDMFDAGRELVRAGLRLQNPSLTEAQMRWQVFLRMYGEDFTPEEIRCIGIHLPNVDFS